MLVNKDNIQQEIVDLVEDGMVVVMEMHLNMVEIQELVEVEAQTYVCLLGIGITLHL
jgi:hypothetical protein